MPKAARLGDPIAHEGGAGGLMAGILAGAAAGALVGAALVATAATGGLAAPLVLAAVGAVVGGLLGAKSTVTGKLISGSENVFINGQAAARALRDKGACSKHSKPQPVMKGSGTVYINGHPAVRVDDKLKCDAFVKDAPKSEVYIGG